MSAGAGARSEEANARTGVRPPQLFVAGPALAQCLADSTGQRATLPLADTAGLQPFAHLARGWETEMASAPSAGSFDLVRRDAARLRQLVSQTAYAHAASENATVVYRLELGEHRQTGVVVEAALEGYRRGRIRRHEATDPDRVHRVGELLSATELELLPVTLVHRPRRRLQALLAQVTRHEPDGRLRTPDGPTQTVWLVRTPELADAIRQQLAALDVLYIADGHHRLAAAERYARQHCPDGGDLAACFVLAILFPSDEVRVLGYHRCVARPVGSAETLLQAVARQPVTERVHECAPEEVPQPAPGQVGLWLDGRWYRVWLRPGPATAGPLATLDVVALENGILGPVLGVGAGTDPRVSTLPGSLGAEEIARRCAEKDMVGFLLHAPGIDQVMAVSDAGLVMPPKSTWFAPKARPGLLIREVRRSGAAPV